MKRKLFMELLDVAWQDFHQAEPEALGMVIVIVGKSPSDEIEVQLGANVPPAVVEHAFQSLVDRWAKGGSPFHQIKPAPLRKIV